MALADKDMETGMKSKQLVEEMKRQVKEMRTDAEKKIAFKRERALEDLVKLRTQYHSAKKKTEAELITGVIKKLQEEMERPADFKRVDIEDEPDDPDELEKDEKHNQYFEYRKSYAFEEKGFIRGKLIFMPDQKVRVIFNYEGKDASEVWDWKDMGDHVQISAGSTLGTIIISERPKSNLKSLLIRWGGQLTNKITSANAE